MLKTVRRTRPDVSIIDSSVRGVGKGWGWGRVHLSDVDALLELIGLTARQKVCLLSNMVPVVSIY